MRRNAVSVFMRRSACVRVIQPRSVATTIAITPKPDPPVVTTSYPYSGERLLRSLAMPLTGWPNSQK